MRGFARLWPSSAALLLLAGSAFAQSTSFQPGQNPVSNQGYNAQVITVGTAYAVSRAIFNGSASACNITAKMNGGSTVEFQNVASGIALPIQTTEVTATTCTTGTLVAIF